jgi:hypothetical protein
MEGHGEMLVEEFVAICILLPLLVSVNIDIINKNRETLIDASK